MWVRVLGSAAGGGFPQWNCTCPPCRAVRDGSRPARPRTQSSIAVSPDYRRVVPAQRLARYPRPDRVLPRPAPPRPRRRAEVPAAGRAAHRRRTRPHARPAAAPGGTRPGAPRHRGGARHAVRRDVAAADARAPTARSSGSRSCRGPTCRWAEGCRTGPSTCPRRSGPGSAPATAKGRVVGYRLTDERSGRGAGLPAGRAGADRGGARPAGGLRLPARRRNLLARRRADPARPGRQDGARDGAPADRRSRTAASRSWPPLPIERKIYIHINNTNPILLEDCAGAAHPRAARHGGRRGRAGAADVRPW